MNSRNFIDIRFLGKLFEQQIACFASHEFNRNAFVYALDFAVHMLAQASLSGRAGLMEDENLFFFNIRLCIRIGAPLLATGIELKPVLPVSTAPDFV
jgi:hypothetical protein